MTREDWDRILESVTDEIIQHAQNNINGDITTESQLDELDVIANDATCFRDGYIAVLAFNLTQMARRRVERG